MPGRASEPRLCGNLPHRWLRRATTLTSISETGTLPLVARTSDLIRNMEFPGKILCASCGAAWTEPALGNIEAVILGHLRLCPKRRGEERPRMKREGSNIEIAWTFSDWGIAITDWPGE